MFSNYFLRLWQEVTVHVGTIKECIHSLSTWTSQTFVYLVICTDFKMGKWLEFGGWFWVCYFVQEKKIRKPIYYCKWMTSTKMKKLVIPAWAHFRNDKWKEETAPEIYFFFFFPIFLWNSMLFIVFLILQTLHFEAKLNQLFQIYMRS